MTSRRRFIAIIPLSGSLLLGRRLAHGQAALLNPTDPQARALGYVTDASSADKGKYPKYEPGQHCGNCQFYQAEPSAAQAPCLIFAGKQVPQQAWCASWLKKA